MKNLLHALKGKRTLIFIDFEGTQFSHEVIAAGLVKARIDESGNITDCDEAGLLTYTQPRSTIGKVVTKMTSLTEEFIRKEGHPWAQTIREISDYIGDDLDNCLFVCFGTNDPKMIQESNRYSHPDNSALAKEWIPHFFDFLAFISQYVRDDNGNTYSLVNFLKLFEIAPVGESHNPLNDAKDLMHLYQAFLNRPDIVFKEYKKILKRMKLFPAPVRDTIASLLDGEDVSSEAFLNRIKEFLA